MEESPRFLQPQTIVGSRLRLRYQNVTGQWDQGCLPTGPPLPRFPEGVTQEEVSVRVAVVVKNPRSTIDDDVVSGEALGGSQPKRLEVSVITLFEERVGQDVAGATGKEHSIRQRPPHGLIAFAVSRRRDPVHGRS